MEKNYFDELPSIKTTAMKLMQLVLEPEASIKDLAELIKYDVGLCAKIIKLANSARYSPNGEVIDIESAIKKIGLTVLKNIVLSITVIDLVESGTFSEETHLQLSKYSITTATAAQFIGEVNNYPHQEMCYLCGLMLYLSYFFLAGKFEENFQQMSQEASSRNIRLAKIIEEKIKLNPFVISYEIAKKWDLPKQVVDSIYYQFTPLDDEITDPNTHHLLQITRAASLATEIFFGSGIKKTNMLHFEEQLTKLEILPEETLENIYNQVQSKLSELQIKNSTHADFNKVLIEANRELSVMNLKYEALYHELSDKNIEMGLLNQKLNARNRLLKTKIMFDDLTGVFNRRYFETELERRFHNSTRKSSPMCLLLIDIDNFKFINDSFGHMAGDMVLKTIANLLKERVRKEDIVARIGGDEFVILPLGLKKEKDAAVLANTIIEAFKEPLIIEDKKILSSVSIGISNLSKDCVDYSELLKDADIAMYQAKARGKNSYFFFNDELDKESKKRIALDMSLSKGIERNEFRLVYQPIIRTKDLQLHGVEALLRWKRPLLKDIPPNEFIPHLEANGQIIPVGKWVIENVIQEVSRWLSNGFDPIQYHINISSRQLSSENFAYDIKHLLEKYNVASNLVGIELTESTLYHNSSEVDIILNQLNSMQVLCSIDDFGTGHSSLMRLKDLPFQTIKIDRAFISTMFNDDDSKHIVEAIIFLAKRLNLYTVAEGVEQEHEYLQLKEWGCDFIQGYYFSKPLEPDELYEFAKNFPQDP